ncbi:MAG: carbohydrate kinase family protein [Brevefilum sp.]|nr:carbohydrate kinase family protein [Brevefilum sp.]
MPHLLVIGGPSIDKLHCNHQTAISAGGAGLYTALAAARSGCQVSMFSPKPRQIPDLFEPLERRLEAWLGPRVALEDMPHFEIAHDGDQANYLEFFVGEEARLDPAGLPQDLSIYNGVHITAIGDVQLQLEFANACRARNAPMISVGSFLALIEEKPELIRLLLERSDVVFLNEAEAVRVYGGLDRVITEAGKQMFITRGRAGALVVQGDFQTALPAVPAKVLDPTGAGDTFCGAALSHLLQGVHPIMAARKAMALASAEIEHVGPTALLFDHAAPDIPLDGRVRIDESQVERIAQVIQRIPEAEPFNFVSDYYPPVGHPAALDFFFVQTLQQFSFWEVQSGRYGYPLVATIDGHACKGSTYLSYAYMRMLDKDPAFFTPERQARTTTAEMLALFQADDGSDPMPAFALHLEKAQAYGRDLISMGLTSQSIIDQAKQSTKPLMTFLSILDHIGGYKEDPFRKKTNLLAMILKERPERFLSLSDDEAIQPVIDYHVMRFCLRTGLVEILDFDLRQKIGDRRHVSVDDEWIIRYACYMAIQRLIQVSGLSMGAVDHVAFNYNRVHCPEMTEPICERCALDPACAHRKDLFQPVIRTTFY